MNDNAALKTYDLLDFINSKDEIEASQSILGTDEVGETTEPYFEVAINNETIGFITLSNLKLIHAQNTVDWTHYTFKRDNEEEFKTIFELPQFQRRRPQLVSVESLKENETDDEFYLLIRGQKSGPYTKTELSSLVSNKEILLTDLVSTNAGHSWLKLYQIDEFDRRHLSENSSLPNLPDREFFDGAALNVNDNNVEVEAMTGLAYLGNIKRGKAIEREREEHLEEAIKKSGSNTTLYKVIFIASLIGIFYMGNSLKNSLKSPFSANNESRIGEQNEGPIIEDPMPTNNELKPANRTNFNNQNNDHFNRGAKIIPRQMNPVRPANNFKRSYTDTQNYRINTQDPDSASGGEESSYYYNDTAPMELDPVRTQVSRETSEGPGVVPSNDPLFNQEVEN